MPDATPDDAPQELPGLTPAEAEGRPAPARDDATTAAARAFVIEAARVLDDLHCEDIVVFDVRGLSQLTDYILIASGTSDRQLKAVASHIGELGQSMDFDRFGTDRDEASTWLVLDFVEVIVHLFEPVKRAHYDLEMMWGDAPKVDWRR